MSAPLDRTALLEGLVQATLEAGAVIQHHFDTGFEVITKADESPVTAADRDAEAVILRWLARLDPQTPVVAEEEAAAGRTPQVGARYYLVDPLDGTREFVRRGSDFTVNIGLIEGAAPTLGVIYAPARGELFAGDVQLGCAWKAKAAPGAAPAAREAMRVRPPAEQLVVLASRSHADPATDRYLAELPVAERVSIGSSLKFARVAAGEADLYPRTGPTMEWDTAAGQAILEAAGGAAFGPEGEPFRYGKPGFRNGAFVATAGFAAPPIAPFVRSA